MNISLQDIYYIFSGIAILCGASYKIGYDIGRNKKINNNLIIER